MTSQGSAYGRFQKALRTNNLMLITTAARDLPFISLQDAARICAVFAERDPDRYGPAAVRWVHRLCTEHPDVPLDEVVAAAGALGQMPARPADAVLALQAIARRAR